MPSHHPYSPTEERLNVVSHSIGFLFSVVGTLLLIIKSVGFKDFIYTTSVIIYGASMMILYAASTLYHIAPEGSRRNRLNIFDHAAIYVLIAGTYTPFTLVTMDGEAGKTLFICVWAFALAGVMLKLFYTGRFDKLSTVLYLFMGWMVVFAYKPLMAALDPQGLYWLLAGGISYTIGAVFYSMPRLVKYNHATFHVFVLIGSLCHYMAVYFWVLP